MALLRSYHSQRFCRAAVGARNSIAASSRFSTSAPLAAAAAEKPRTRKRAPDPIFTSDIKVPQDVAIIGAGITGLTTAHYLAKWLPETSRITIYDSSNRVGGWINTETVDVNIGGQNASVRFERGPRTLRGMGKDTWKMDDYVMWDMMRDVGLMDQYLGMTSPPRFICHENKLVTMNALNGLFHPVFKGAIPGILTAAFRRQRARDGRHPADMSVSDFVKLATGRPEITENLVSAMIHGIWGGDPDKLSMRSFMPAQWWRYYYAPSKEDRPHYIMMPRNEVSILSRLYKDDELCGYAAMAKKHRLVVFKDGMSALPNAIENSLRRKKNVFFKLGDPVMSIRYEKNENPNKSRIHVSTAKRHNAEYDKVISTTTSNQLVAVTRKTLPSLAESPNVSIMTVNLWYPKPRLNPEGVGYLMPRSAEDNLEGLLGVFFDSDVVHRPDGEPDGTKLFVLMGGHHWEGMTSPPTEEEGIQMAKAILERHLGIPTDTECFAMASFARNCIPQHHVGHWKRLTRANSELRHYYGGKLAVAGGSYTSIGVMGGMRAGYDMAYHLAKHTLDHVGDTGLAGFADRTLSLWKVGRELLVRGGRDIKPKLSKFESWFA